MKKPQNIFKETGKLPVLGLSDLNTYIQEKDEESLRFFLKHYSNNIHEHQIIVEKCFEALHWLEGIGILAEEVKTFNFSGMVFYKFEFTSQKEAQPILDILFNEKNAIHKKLKKSSYAYGFYQKELLTVFLKNNEWFLEPSVYTPIINKLEQNFFHNSSLIKLCLEHIAEPTLFKKTPLDFFKQIVESRQISPFTLLQKSMQKIDKTNKRKQQQLEQWLQQFIKYSVDPIYVVAAQIEAMQLKPFPEQYISIVESIILDKQLELHHHHLISTITFLICNQEPPFDFLNREINNDDYMDKLSDAFYYSTTQKEEEIEIRVISTFEFFNQIRKFNEKYHFDQDINAILDSQKINSYIEKITGIKETLTSIIKNKPNNPRF